MCLNCFLTLGSASLIYVSVQDLSVVDLSLEDFAGGTDIVGRKIYGMRVVFWSEVDCFASFGLYFKQDFSIVKSIF